MCNVCHDTDAKTRYIDLHVFGSEGLRLCRPCENEVCSLVEGLALQKTRKRKQQHLAKKRGATQDNSRAKLEAAWEKVIDRYSTQTM